jgi:hypothetical protein
VFSLSSVTNEPRIEPSPSKEDAASSGNTVARTKPPRDPRAPSSANADPSRAGRSRRTFSESIIVAFAALECAFQTGPP